MVEGKVIQKGWKMILEELGINIADEWRGMRVVVQEVLKWSKLYPKMSL